MTGEFAVRDAVAADATAVAGIYNHYVRDSVITFEVDAVPVEDIAARIAMIVGAGLPYLVVEHEERAGGDVFGFAYAGPFQERAAYRHSVELTVYLAPDAGGRGAGTALYEALLARLRLLGPGDSPHAPVHRVYGRIALPNAASVALHERVGLRRIGVLSEVGRKFDTWIDVGFWEGELR